MTPLDLPPMPAYGALPTPPQVDVVALDLPVGRLSAYRVNPDGRAGSEPRATALLVPGYTGSKEDFRAFLPLLRERGIAALAFSRRGQADSAAPASGSAYTLDEEAADVVRVARLQVDSAGGRPVHLLGHSLGGVIARAAAIAAPELFASVTLFCSGPHGWRNRKYLESGLAATEGNSAIWRATNPEAALLPDDELDADTRFVRDRFDDTSPLSVIGGADILEDIVDRTADLAATGVPVLVAHGVDDTAWPISWQRDMAERLGARYAVIRDAAHGPQIENPSATAALLDDFWTSAERNLR